MREVLLNRAVSHHPLLPVSGIPGHCPSEDSRHCACPGLEAPALFSVRLWEQWGRTLRSRLSSTQIQWLSEGWDSAQSLYLWCQRSSSSKLPPPSPSLLLSSEQLPTLSCTEPEQQNQTWWRGDTLRGFKEKEKPGEISLSTLITVCAG